MSKHTPGPWRVTGTMTKYVEAKIGNGRIQEVASVGPTEADKGYGSEQNANAMLIAAAPDLLEALKAMRDKYGEYACYASDLADAAIAKVTSSR